MKKMRWIGRLTMTNRRKIAGLLWKLLYGQTYTYVIVEEGQWPTVKTDQRLPAGSQANMFDLHQENGFHFFTTSHTWRMLNGTLFSFLDNQVTIRQINGNNCIYVVFAVQAQNTTRDPSAR